MDVSLGTATLLIPTLAAIGFSTVLTPTQRFFYLLPLGIWLFSAVTAMTNPFSFPAISFATISVIAVFLTAFAFSVVAGILGSRTTKKTSISVRTGHFIISEPPPNQIRIPRLFMGAITVFLVFFYGFYLKQSLSFLMSNGMSAEYRMLAMGYGVDSVIFSSKLESFFFATLIRGALFIFLCISSFLFFFEGQRRYFVLAALLMTADSIITFGRYFVYIFFIVYITGSIASSRGLYSRNAILVAAAALSIIGILSAGRFEDGLNVGQFLYRYLIGYHIYGVFLLDHLIHGGVDYELWYGGATFSGLAFILSKPIDMAGMEVPLFLSSATAFEQSQLIRLGQTADIIFTANAFYTMISDMLIDGGIFAVVLFTSLFGFVYGRAIQSFTSLPNVKNFSVVVLLLICFFFSILKNQLSQFYIVIALSFFYIVPVSLYTSKIGFNDNRKSKSAIKKLDESL